MDVPTPTSTPDLFRHTPIRYLGYANEVGEAFRSIIGTKWVNLSYGIATIYVLADTAHKSHQTYNQNVENKSCLKKTLFVTADTLLWQMLASVIIPGFTINRVCAFSHYVLKKSEKLPSKTARKWIVTGVGLATIPFIIKPIDKLVDESLDRSFRKLAP